MLLFFGLAALFRGIVAAATWDVIIKTCDVPGAGTDASVYLKIYYAYANSDETFLLDHESRNDFERGSRDHFKIVVNSSDIVSLGLFWWPSLSLNQNWCVDWLTLMNSSEELCIIARFDKWILHYKDPPTYPVNFTKTSYAQTSQVMRCLLVIFVLLPVTHSDEVNEDDVKAQWHVFTQVCKDEEWVGTWWGTDIVIYLKDGTNKTFLLREGGPNYGMGRGELLQTKIEMDPLPGIGDILLMNNKLPVVGANGAHEPAENLPCIRWLVMIEPAMDVCHAFYFYKYINTTENGGSFPAKKELNRPHADCIMDIMWKAEDLRAE